MVPQQKGTEAELEHGVDIRIGPTFGPFPLPFERKGHELGAGEDGCHHIANGEDVARGCGGGVDGSFRQPGVQLGRTMPYLAQVQSSRSFG